MVNTAAKKLTKDEFWAIADAAAETYELWDGVAVVKMSPKYWHSRSTGLLFTMLQAWADDRGRVGIEWAVDLAGGFVLVPDLLYVSFDRLPITWQENAACPVAPELAIEIISPGQTFGQMIQKASCYLSGGVLRVWVIDPIAQTVTIFYPDAPPASYTGAQVITDAIFPGLSIVTAQIF